MPLNDPLGIDLIAAAAVIVAVFIPQGVEGIDPTQTLGLALSPIAIQ